MKQAIAFLHTKGEKYASFLNEAISRLFAFPGYACSSCELYSLLISLKRSHIYRGRFTAFAHDHIFF
jgi:hypothetical protein